MKKMMIGLFIFALGLVAVIYVRNYLREQYAIKQHTWEERAQVAISDYFRCLEEEETGFCLDNFMSNEYEGFYSREQMIEVIERDRKQLGKRESGEIIPESKGYFLNDDGDGNYVRVWFKSRGNYRKKEGVLEYFTLVKQRDKDYLLISDYHYESDEEQED